MQLAYYLNYFNSTVAPASSNLAFNSLASSIETFSLIFPPASAISLASFNPKPVISRITLITLILAAPALTNTTVAFEGPYSTAAVG